MDDYLLMRDAVGWKLAAFKDYDGSCFLLESGRRVSKTEGWIADPDNVKALLRGERKLAEPEDLMYPSLKAPDLLAALGSGGYQLDAEWRIRKSMGLPMTELKTDRIMALFVMHLSWHKEQKLDPENKPMHMVWLPEPHKVPGLLFPDGRLGLTETDQAMGVQPGGGGDLCVMQDKMGWKQVVLKWSDWYAYPKAYRPDMHMCTLFVEKFMKDAVPMEADGIPTLLGSGKFLTPEGTILNKGGFLAISIDDFFPKEGA
jgi:hypothetical protein